MARRRWATGGRDGRRTAGGNPRYHLLEALQRPLDLVPRRDIVLHPVHERRVGYPPRIRLCLAAVVSSGASQQRRQPPSQGMGTRQGGKGEARGDGLDVRGLLLRHGGGRRGCAVGGLRVGEWLAGGQKFGGRAVSFGGVNLRALAGLTRVGLLDGLQSAACWDLRMGDLDVQVLFPSF